jgi:hypothetical protein
MYNAPALDKITKVLGKKYEVLPPDMGVGREWVKGKVIIRVWERPPWNSSVELTRHYRKV